MNKGDGSPDNQDKAMAEDKLLTVLSNRCEHIETGVFDAVRTLDSFHHHHHHHIRKIANSKHVYYARND